MEGVYRAKGVVSVLREISSNISSVLLRRAGPAQRENVVVSQKEGELHFCGMPVYEGHLLHRATELPVSLSEVPGQIHASGDA